MQVKNTFWQYLTKEFTPEIHSALLHQHHASQFIALAGRHLVQQEKDDSNTNMQYLPQKHLLAGNLLPNNMRLALHLPSLNICFIEAGDICILELELDGKNKQQVFKELKEGLNEMGLDVSGFVIELHYELPDHPLDEGAEFSAQDRSSLQENSYYRHNTEIILQEVVKGYDKTEPVRVWPHHFDTGTLIPLAYDAQGELIRSIGLGWAIPDSMVDEPYFYLSYWSAQKEIEVSSLPDPEAGTWSKTGWNGGILRHSEILQENASEKQYALASRFFDSGIELLIEGARIKGFS